MKIEHDYLPRKSRLKVFGLALLVGLIAGTLSIGFHRILYQGTGFVKTLIYYQPAILFILPVLVYIFLYWSNHYVLEGDVIFGVAALERELREINIFFMKPLKVIFKMLNTLLALVCGFAVGQFGPTLYLGGAIGSNIGYFFKLPNAFIRMLIGCGVSAAIAAIMHLPLFAVVFTIEVIFSKRYFDYMLPLIISSLTAYGLDRLYTGEIFLFDLNRVYHLNFLSNENWLVIILLGLALGVLAAAYVIVLRYSSKYFAKLRQQIGFLLFLSLSFALIYYFMPSSHYFDFDYIFYHLADDVGFLLVLLLLRFCLTTMQLASGVYGGYFSPGLIIGIIFGLLVFNLLPIELTAGMNLLFIVTLSVVGMFSGFAHAPLSAVILALESSGEMSILMPALIISIISHMVSDFIAEESLFDLN